MAHECAAEFSASDLDITAHVGEMSLVNVETALDTPGLTRPGHGIQFVHDERLLAQMVRHSITLECCRSSNALYGAVPSLEADPLRKLRDAGAAVTLNTDDPIRVGTSIGREYALALGLGLSLEDLEAITAQTLEASFTTEDRRTRVREWLGTVSRQGPGARGQGPGARGQGNPFPSREKGWVWVVERSRMPAVRASSA